MILRLRETVGPGRCWRCAPWTVVASKMALAALLAFPVRASGQDAAPAMEQPPQAAAAENAASPASPAVPATEAPALEASRDAELIAAVAAKAPGLLADYIAVDTTNPPGNEIAGARFIASVLEAEGIETRIFESEPGRGNLYARLKGNGSKRPLILLSHIDVVPVDRKRWSHQPYGGTVEEDGRLYGRGALDAKGVGVVQLLGVVALKRLGRSLDRDVILLATADEETGGRLGAGWMVENHLELFEDAEFVLNEGGFILRSENMPLIYNVDAAEKGPCWFRIIASGTPGHGSRPASQTAVTRLIHALSTLLSWQRPLEVGPVVAGYFAAYAALDTEHARQLRQLGRSLEDEAFRSWFMQQPAWAALVSDTLAPNVLVGSVKTNIVPAQAMAEVDSRLLPGHSCDDFLAEVAKLVAGEHLRVEPTEVSFPSSQSPLDSELTMALERLAASDGEKAVVLPGLLSGFTDSHYFREKGMAAYGFVPLAISDRQRGSIHAPDENVGADELVAAVVRMVRLLEELGG